MKKKALITGISGQDGYYLTAYLLQKDYEVVGLIRRCEASLQSNPIKTLKSNENLTLEIGDVTDPLRVNQIISDIKPDEIYNLGAQTHVKVSFDNPLNTSNVNAIGCLSILEAIKNNNLINTTKFYQAGTSEMFGAATQSPQNEHTPFQPQSPYAVAKLYAHWMTKNYRKAYGLFAANGILFNHESPFRDPSFVTRKITKAVAHIKAGQQDKLLLGNLNARRDWGHARDYVAAMWLMLNHDTPDDFVIATGKTTTVREFCSLAFAAVNTDLEWQGEGLDEIAIDTKTGHVLVAVDQKFFRPLEVNHLHGDPTKAVQKLGWNPQKTALESLINEMVAHDSAALL